MRIPSQYAAARLSLNGSCDVVPPLMHPAMAMQMRLSVNWWLGQDVDRRVRGVRQVASAREHQL